MVEQHMVRESDLMPPHGIQYASMKNLFDRLVVNGYAAHRELTKRAQALRAEVDDDLHRLRELVTTRLRRE